MTTKKRYFLDTNILLELHDKLFETYDNFIISSVTIQELEHIKTSGTKSEEVRYKARKAVKVLNKNLDNFTTVFASKEVKDILVDYDLEMDNDNLIIACCKQYEDLHKDEEIVFVTNDLCCRLIAKDIFKLEVQNNEDNDNYDYTGYKILNIDTTNEKENNLLADIYENSTKNPLDLLINEYIIIKDTSCPIYDETMETFIDYKTIDKFRWNGESLVRIKGFESKYRKLKPLNVLQECAIDLLLNKDIKIKIIVGGFGTGKTLLSVKTAMYQLEKGYFGRLFLVRNPLTQKAVGFLPGSFNEKTDSEFRTIYQHFDGKEFEYEEMKRTGRLETNIPLAMKGLSIKDSIILCDEAEDLTVKDIKTIGSRLEKDSCVVFSGDYKQSEREYKNKANNGIMQLIHQKKGNELVGIIVLDEDLRSSASKVFAEIE